MPEHEPPDDPRADEAGAPKPIPRRKVGRYELVASLGRGGAGEVFLALAEGPGGFQKLVVVKMLHPHLQEDPQVVAMFLDEARLAAKLNHPSIVQTLEVGTDDDGHHFIAMTFLEGLPLHRILARFGQRGEGLPPEIAARIATEVLDGLAYAHTLKDIDATPLHIVHRDVSPANVFVTWDGSVKILDFGIAKAARRQADTDSGVIKGKFAYIAPEQAMGEPVDARTDLWSVGVLLWEMLSGRRMFPQFNDVMTLRRLVDGPLPKLEEVAPEVPSGLVAIVERALRRDPEERWESAAAMKAALEGWLNTLARSVTRDDVAACIGDVFAGERGRQQEIVRMCVGAPRLTATPSGSFAVRDETSRKLATLPPPEPESTRPPRGPLVLAAAVCMALGAIVAGAALDDTSRARTTSPQRDEDRALSATASAGEPAPTPRREARAASPGQATAPRAASSTQTAEHSPHATSAGQAADRAASAEAAAEARPRLAPSRSATPTSSRPRRGERPNRASSAAPTPSPGSATPTPSDDEAEAAASPGFLSLDTSPWSVVSLGDRELGTTPLVRVPLPPGRHELVLRNPERDLVQRYVVTIRAGETTARRLGLD